MKDFSTLPSLKTTIDAYGLAAKKSLGQHFLLDTSITDRIVSYAGDIKEHHIVEIGPGPGGLTRSLLKAGAKKCYVIEKDERCVAALAELKKISDGRLEIISGDALEIDLVKEIPAPRKIIANLPYNAGTQMLINWMDAVYEHGQGAFASLTLMFQKEVAERITASHGNKDYGRLSVLCQWLCDVRYDMELPPGAFSPPPKVSSAVVTLTPRAKPLVDVSKDALEKVVAAAFGQRRKMLRSALKSLGCDVEKLLATAGIDGTLRAEQVDLKTLCNLAKCFESLSIRKDLEEITNPEKCDKLGIETLDQQISAINAVGIKNLPEPEDWKHKPSYYCQGRKVIIVCYAYALGLGESNQYRKLVCDYQPYRADSKFIKFIIEQLLIQPIDKPNVGDVIVYFDEKNNPKHAGIIINSSQKVRSQWSSIAIFEHELWHVPKSYGCAVRYYQHIDISYAEKIFSEYLKVMDSRLRGNDE